MGIMARRRQKAKQAVEKAAKALEADKKKAEPKKEKNVTNK